MTASFTFYSGNEKKIKIFFFFPTALVEFLRGQFGLRHPSKLDFSFCSRIDFFFIILIIIGYFGKLFFRAPLNLLLCEFPFNPPFIFSDTTNRAKRRRDGGGKHVSSGFLSLCFLSLLLSSPLYSCFAVFSFLFFFPKPR